jgi:hypothetical protein
MYMKPRLIHNWPEVKKEHDEITYIVKKVIKEYTAKKELSDESYEKSKNDFQVPSSHEIPRASRDEIMYEHGTDQRKTEQK